MSRAWALWLAAAALRCAVPQVLGASAECAPGATEPCAGRSACGVCPEAARRCDAAGRWGACVTAGRSAEYLICAAGRDEDCDGVCNSDEPACRCASRDAVRACYPGPDGTLGVGRCRAGAQDCAAGRFAACGGGLVEPAATELCGNGVDDDCDGATDEDCAAPRVLAVAVGDARSCAVVREGAGSALLCWGAGADGVFGSDPNDRFRPTRTAAPAGVRALAMGASHLCVTDADGAVWCAGANASGQLGQGSLEARAGFVRVPTLSGVRALAAGRDHTCGLLADGRVTCWGSDGLGQTGAGDGGVACETGRARGCRPTPAAVPGVTGATRVTAGFEHSCAASAAGVWCWGEGSAFGEAAAATGPTRVFAGEGPAVAGRRGVCQRDGASGRWRCLGDARGTFEGAEAFAALAAGAKWCGVTAAGRVQCTVQSWATKAQRGDPADVLGAPLPALSGAVTALAVGFGHACAAVGAQTVVCWGLEDARRRGQLGDPRPGDVAAPREVWW